MSVAPAPARAGPTGALGILRRAPAWTLTALLAVVYLLIAPKSPDLAAASYRTDLFDRAGFTIWDNSWYGGHHLPAYSALAPALGAVLGPALLAALSMTAAAALFEVAVGGRFPARAARVGALWFAFGAGMALLSSRVPFALGLAIGLAAVVLALRGRWVPALALAVVTALASPVAAAFLALASVAWALAASRRADRIWALALAACALAPVALLAIAFPEGGTQPFVGSAFYPPLAALLAIGLVLPPEQRTLRIGTALYALALIGVFVIPSAVGGNVDRLGAVAAGPLAACALLEATPRWRHAALLVLAVPLTYWQVLAPLTDLVAARSETAAVEESYYQPLLGELRSLRVGYGRRTVRIEVVPTVDHWEARYLAPAVMMARGWERQLDRYRNSLFYEQGALNPVSYHEWLAEQAVSFVALPDASLDYSGRDEASIVRSPFVNGRGGFLHEVWRSRHWRLFAVHGSQPIAEPSAVVSAATTDSFTLRAAFPGKYWVRLRYTPYWGLSSGSGCVEEGEHGWTAVRVKRPGSFHVGIDFSLARVFDHGARCR